MADFGRREIFIDLTSAKKSTQRISIYLSIFLLIIAIGGFFIQPKERILFVFIFLMVLLGLIGLWIGYFNQVKRYQNQPYLVLDEIGVEIFSQNSTDYVRWVNIKDIDEKRTNGQNPTSYYFIETDRMIRLDNNMTTNMIITLKRYAERYGTARFIF